jgi:membrane-associated protease RseP (regulator of RpoE activity)
MMTIKNKSPQLLLAMTTLVMLSTASAEPSGFITSAQSNALDKQQTVTTDTTATIKPSLTNTALTNTTTLGYLGIGFDRVPASIRAHLAENVSVQQGLIVTRFANTSSAAQAGMKVHDVLLTYDGQRIEKPEDFIQKIRKDKAGRIVTFTLVRQGKVLTLPVIMGSQIKKKSISPAVQQQAGNPYQPPAQLASLSARKTAPNANFNGLAIRKIGNDIYDASIGFMGQDGKPQRRSYKGNRMRILQQIMQANDLPAQAKQQLLFAVQPRQQSQQSSNWGGMPTMPFGNNNGFNPNRLFNGWNW